MADSIIQADRTHCFICGGNGGYWGLDCHHCFGGSSRKLSEKYGLKIWICHDSCHLNGVHQNAKLDRMVKQTVQRRAMEIYGWDESQFINIFGKSYL